MTEGHPPLPRPPLSSSTRIQRKPPHTTHTRGSVRLRWEFRGGKGTVPSPAPHWPSASVACEPRPLQQRLVRGSLPALRVHTLYPAPPASLAFPGMHCCPVTGLRKDLGRGRRSRAPAPGYCTVSPWTELAATPSQLCVKITVVLP